jgi:hypothetical protein
MSLNIELFKSYLLLQEAKSRDILVVQLAVLYRRSLIVFEPYFSGTNVLKCTTN